MRSKYYCLGCERPNNCNCGQIDFHVYHSHKLRPPLSTKNKTEFRNFLDACPIFVNLVTEEQRPAFLTLLRKVKYFNKSINGNDWTNINK